MAESDIYEFNAPQYYFDLTEKNEPDDSYFDCTEGSGPYKLETPLAQATKTPLRSSSRHNQKRPFDGITPKKALPPSKTPKREVKQRPAEIPPFPEEESKENIPQNHVEEPAKKGKGSSQGTKQERNSSGVGVRSSPRLAAIAKAVRRSNADRRSAGVSRTSDGNERLKQSKPSRRSAGASSRRSSGRGGSLNGVSKPRMQKQSLPKVSGIRQLNSEDMSSLEQIATITQQKSGARRGASRPGVTVPQEFSFATNARLKPKKQEEPAANTKRGPLKAIHHQGPTRPQEFHFATDSRIKKSSVSEDSDDVAAFPNTLRSDSSAHQDKELPKGPTIPQPFKLSESRKTSNGEVNKFVSVAELNIKFHMKTPQRFRSKPKGEPEPQTQQNKNKITIPVTPNFTTRARSRQSNYLTREEMEQKEFEEEQKNMFKAHPVNKKILDGPKEVVNNTRKKSTIPEPFNITKTKKEEAPLGSGLKEMCTNLGFSASSLASLPWGGVPSKWEKSSTKVQPFSFDARDKHTMQKKQEKIKEIIEEEKKQAEFYAQPMPIFEEGVRGLPPKRAPTPTKLQPFRLRCDEKGEYKKEEHKRKLEEEERLDRERRKFHAQSDAVVYKEPFIPEKSDKPLTNISGFQLNTEVRAEARTDFEIHQKMKEDELLAAKKEREEREEMEAAQEVARLRREAVHKANPVRQFKPMEIKPSEHPLTVPKSPDFATTSRLRSRKNDSLINSTMDSMANVSSATFTTD